MTLLRLVPALAAAIAASPAAVAADSYQSRPYQTSRPSAYPSDTRASSRRASERRSEVDWYPVKDLRLTIGQAPGADRIETDTWSGGDITFETDGEASTGGSITFSYGRLYEGGGMIVATGVDLWQGTVTGSPALTPGIDIDFDTQRWGGLIKFGYGLPFGATGLHLEVLPYAGVGFGSISAAGGTSDTMSVGRVGIEGGLYYRFGIGRAGLMGGWDYFSGWGDTVMRGNGPMYGASLGFAF